MNAGEAIRRFRSEIAELNIHFPLDSDLLIYLDEGYKEFVRLANGVPDEIMVDVDANEPEVELPEYVMRVREVIKVSDNKPLEIINYTDVPSKSATEYGRLTKLPLDLTEKGEIRYFMIGAKGKVARLVAIPEVADELKLLVNRMPTTSISSLTQRFDDIEDVYQPALVEWMKSRMYRRPTKDLFNPNMGEFFENRFKRIADEAGKAQDLFKTKKRIVAYGGY